MAHLANRCEGSDFDDDSLDEKTTTISCSPWWPAMTWKPFLEDLTTKSMTAALPLASLLTTARGRQVRGVLWAARPDECTFLKK